MVGMEAGLTLGMEGCGIPDHENVGAAFLQCLQFTPRIRKLVQSHVSAKRYLCYVQPTYFSSLSDASKTTLRYQGGPMTAQEAEAYEKDADFEIYKLMRSWDEAAKIPSYSCPRLDAYADMIAQMSSLPSDSDYVLSPAQFRFWKENGFLMVKNLLPYYNLSADTIISAVEDISKWEKVSDKWLLHWEQVPGGAPGEKMMCRAENFADYHESMGHLCRGPLLHLCSRLFEEAAVLFKEKINFKLPGGGGFAAHQDSPAYIGLGTEHISIMVAIDHATIENGCLEVAPGVWREGQVPLTSDGIVTPEAEANMAFRPVECSPGDVLVFTGYLPHRSKGNASTKSRRAMFITYNPASQGDFHADYYRAKHTGAQGFSASNKISFQNDFQGKIID